MYGAINKKAVYRFLKYCLKKYKHDRQPKTPNTDQHSSYGNTISRLKDEGLLREDVAHRQVKYLNNRIESDHAPLKKLITTTYGFKRYNRA
ncbi:hypothetical protein AT251_22795 [Enterovibrio nigricans]|nr:hypothetical protein AT251_22795 [Enterovibrio nigricans]